MLVMQINYVNYAPRTVSIRFGWMQKLHAMRDRKHDTKLMTRPAAARRSPGAGDTVMIQWPLTQLDPTYFDLLCWLDYSIRSLGLCYCPTWPLPCPHNDRRGTTRGIMANVVDNDVRRRLSLSVLPGHVSYNYYNNNEIMMTTPTTIMTIYCMAAIIFTFQSLPVM